MARMYLRCDVFQLNFEKNIGRDEPRNPACESRQLPAGLMYPETGGKKKNFIRQEPMSRSRQLLSYLASLTAFLQTDLFLECVFFRERKGVPTQ